MNAQAPTALTAEDQAANRDAIRIGETIVDLDEGFQVGNQTIRCVTVRKPKTGALRGLNLSEILQLNVNALIKILPRVTEPAMTEEHVNNLDPADITLLGAALIGFFVSSKDRSQNA